MSIGKIVWKSENLDKYIYEIASFLVFFQLLYKLSGYFYGFDNEIWVSDKIKFVRPKVSSDWHLNSSIWFSNTIEID